MQIKHIRGTILFSSVSLFILLITVLEFSPMYENRHLFVYFINRVLAVIL